MENPGSSSLPSPKNSTRDQNKGTKQKKVPAETEKIARSGIEILSSIEVLDSDEEMEVQKNRENVKRNIREILAETDGVVTIDDSDDEQSSNEENNKNPKSKNNNHKSNSNHLDDLLDTDQENGENDTDEEEEAESELEPVKKVPRTKRNEPRSFVKSGYDLVKSRSRKKSTDVVSRRELPTKKKQKSSTKIIPEVIIPPPAVEHPPTPPEVCQDEKGNFIVKKVLKSRVSFIKYIFAPSLAFLWVFDLYRIIHFSHFLPELFMTVIKMLKMVHNFEYEQNYKVIYSAHQGKRDRV